MERGLDTLEKIVAIYSVVLELWGYSYIYKSVVSTKYRQQQCSDSNH